MQYLLAQVGYVKGFSKNTRLVWNPTKNFTEVANMTSLRLKNKLAAYSHALKNMGLYN